MQTFPCVEAAVRGMSLHNESYRNAMRQALVSGNRQAVRGLATDYASGAYQCDREGIVADIIELAERCWLEAGDFDQVLSALTGAKVGHARVIRRGKPVFARVYTGLYNEDPTTVARSGDYVITLSPDGAGHGGLVPLSAGMIAALERLPAGSVSDHSFDAWS